MAGRRAPRRWPVVVGVSVAVTAAALLLAAYLAPRVLPNLFTRVSDVAEPQTVADGAATATVVVPAGWAAQRAWGSESELVVRSPDGGFAVTLTLSAVDPAATVSADDRAEGRIPIVENLASGLDAAHAQTDEVLVLAVGRVSSSPSLRMLAPGTPDAIDPYRPVLAELIESVRVGP